MRQRFWQGPAGDGAEGLGVRRARDGRSEMPVAAIIEDAPEFATAFAVRCCPYDWRTIWGAAALGYTRILTSMLDRGESSDKRDHEGRTPLSYATDYQQTASLCLLLERGAAPNSPDDQGQTPVFYAIGPQAEVLLTVLINGGADINHRDHAGHSPLLHAIVHGRKRLRLALQRCGARLGFPEAAAIGDYRLAEGLSAEVDLDAALPNGETLLTRAVRQGDFSVAALLLRRGADPNQRDTRGITPLEAAEDRGRLLRLLLDSGADPAFAPSLQGELLRRRAGLSLGS